MAGGEGGGSTDSPHTVGGQEASPGDEAAQRERYQRARVRARHLVYERLALLSAAIWAVGALVLFIALVPPTARPQPYILLASVLPLIPAAIPWLFYRPISDALARRWAQREDGTIEDGLHGES